MRYQAEMRLPLILPVVLLCAACSRPDNASGAGGVSAGETRALDDAAQMLDDQNLPAAAIPQPRITPAPQPNAVSQTPEKGSAKPVG